jgi:hypothetical protein
LDEAARAGGDAAFKEGVAFALAADALRRSLVAMVEGENGAAP